MARWVRGAEARMRWAGEGHGQRCRCLLLGLGTLYPGHLQTRPQRPRDREGTL